MFGKHVIVAIGNLFQSELASNEDHHHFLGFSMLYLYAFRLRSVKIMER